MQNTLALIITLITISGCFPTFKEFKIQYKKTYDTEEEQSYRAVVYRNNIVELELQNSKNLGYTVDVNEWSDLTDDEIQSKIRSPPPKDIVYKPISSANLKVGAAASLDWRLNCAVTPARNQGSCGACWAFSTVSVAESYIYLATGNHVSLSEQYVLQCTISGDCQGGYPADAMSLMLLSGASQNSDYPYTAAAITKLKPSTLGICTPSNLINLPNNTTLQAYYKVKLQNMKSLLTVSPVAVYFWAPSNFMKYSKGIYSCSRAATADDLNHGIQVIGYDSNNNYIIKNSWGTSWGQNGFGYVQSNQTKDCGIHMIVLAYTGATLSYSDVKTCVVNQQSRIIVNLSIVLCILLLSI